MLDKAMACETADELIKLAEEAGINLTKAEAEAYMAELENMELGGIGYLDYSASTCFLVFIPALLSHSRSGFL